MGAQQTPGQAAAPLTDEPAQDSSEDRLGFADIAAAMSAMLESEDVKTPLITALNGPWGSGKTSLSNMIIAGLRSRDARENPFLFYDAWQNDIGDEGAAPLLREAAACIDELRTPSTRMFRGLGPHFLAPRRRIRRMIKRFLGWAIVAGLAYWLVAQIVDIGAWIPWTQLRGPLLEAASFGAIISTVVAIASRALTIAPTLSSQLRKRSSLTSQEDLTRARDEFSQLVQEAIPGKTRRYFIVIDNLDRCRNSTSLDVLNAVKKILAVEKVVVILPVDMEVLGRQLGARLRADMDLTQAEADGQARLYLEKIVNLQFDLPSTSPVRVASLLDDDDRSGDDEETVEEKADVNLRDVAKAAFLGPFTQFWHPAKRAWKDKEIDFHRNFDVMLQRRSIYALWLLSAYGGLNLGFVILRWMMDGVLHTKYPHHDRFKEASTESLPVPPRWARICGTIGGVLGVLLFWPYGWMIWGFHPWSMYVVYGFATLLTIAVLGWSRTVANARDEDMEALEEARTRGREDAMANRPREPSFETKGRVSREMLHTWYLAGFFREKTAFRLVPTDMEPILNFLLPNPRHVKRFKNRTRLLGLIVTNRPELSVGHGITATHVTKWAVLEERWPHLARRVRDNPALMATWETSGTGTATNSGPGEGDPVFEKFLACNPPLGDKASYLATLSQTGFPGISLPDIPVRDADNQSGMPKERHAAPRESSFA